MPLRFCGGTVGGGSLNTEPEWLCPAWLGEDRGAGCCPERALRRRGGCEGGGIELGRARFPDCDGIFGGRVGGREGMGAPDR